MAATVRGAIRELMEQTMTTMDALLEASDRELTMPSSHARAREGCVDPHRERQLLERLRRRQSHARCGRPSGGSHGTVPMSAGTEISRISSVSEVAISLWRRPPEI
jgi:hypothetical protein